VLLKKTPSAEDPRFARMTGMDILLCGGRDAKLKNPIERNECKKYGDVKMEAEKVL
jgi:hypothetical protein